jgi:HlyD family secretion protein
MKKPDRRPLILGVAGVVVVILIAVLVWGGPGGEGAVQEAIFTVQEGPLTISVSEPGSIKNRDQVVLKSEVEGRAAILFLVKEGVRVKKGDLVVELDSKAIEDQRVSQAITVTKAEASFINARENLAVVKSQAESDVAKAELDLKFAELDLRKYVEGDYPASLQQADTDITIATEEVQRAEEKLNWSRKLHEQRYLSKVELQADELAHKKAKLELDLAINRKKVLEEFSHQRDKEALVSSVGQAKMALDRVTRKASADVVQAEADLKAKESEFQRQKTQLEKLETQLRKTKIIAPIDGMVVYATTGQGGRWGSDEQPLKEGREVREREELIYLPTAQSMLAEVKIHESSLKKVQVGMECHVTVDAVPGRAYEGKVARIGVMPDQGGWMNPDLKVYNTEIHLDDGTDLRAGMSCRAEIIVETFEKATYVPVQCVVRKGGKTVVYRKGSKDPVPVEIGLDNNRMVRILSGLSGGDLVLLEPPLKEEASPQREEGGPGGRPVEKPAVAPAPPPEQKPAASGETDWRSLSPEERKKRMDALTPEQRAAMMEEMKKRRESSGGSR